MEFSLPIFIIVLLLGVLQLTVGIVIGRLLPIRKGHTRQIEPGRSENLRLFAGKFRDLVTNVADEVSRHRSKIEQVNEELASMQPPEGEALTAFVLKTVAQIIQINERLQNRLSDAEERLQQQTRQIEAQVVAARTDPLTGLPNRRAFDDELVRRLAEWQRKKAVFCLMMVDIDHFKRFNDEHGHPAGDQVLSNVAEVLRGTLRDMDMVARIGGEEFAVVLPSTNAHDAARAVERVLESVGSAFYVFEQVELHVTASLGLAIVQIGDDGASLVKRADEALYAAKNAGRNCGFYHDGRICRQIATGSRLAVATVSPPAKPDTGGPDDEESAQLAVICGDLRQRLVEVADEG